MKTLRKHNRNKKTRSLRRNTQNFEQEIVLQFLHMLVTVKLYHWKTHDFANHKATDELYGKLNEGIDKFVEILLGKTGGRVNLTHVRSLPICDFTSLEQMKREIEKYKSYLIGLDSNKAMKSLHMINSDLFNVRDEILGDLNQYLYLSTLHWIKWCDCTIYYIFIIFL